MFLTKRYSDNFKKNSPRKKNLPEHNPNPNTRPNLLWRVFFFREFLFLTPLQHESRSYIFKMQGAFCSLPVTGYFEVADLYSLRVRCSFLTIYSVIFACYIFLVTCCLPHCLYRFAIFMDTFFKKSYFTTLKSDSHPPKNFFLFASIIALQK